jgi:two-component system, chemotaxis family, CheB/CheR fusion protein
VPEIQKKLIPLFHYCLNPGGILFLGSAETIGAFSRLFASLEGRQRLYKRLDSGQKLSQVDFPPSFSPALSVSSALVDRQPKSPNPFSNIQKLTDQLLLQRFAPAAVLVNSDGDVLYVNGHTGKYLELAAGKMNWNIFTMAREGLRYDLHSAFQKAVREKEIVTVKDLIVGSNGGNQAIDLTIQPQQDADGLPGTILVIFEDVETPPEQPTTVKSRHSSDSHPQFVQLEKELQYAREEVRTIREEMQTSEEELKSSYEELQSTNEELQSTNEELTTSKEEMQSMNEELQTVNSELQSKVEDLSQLNNDMKNLLNSTDIATLFLDDALCIRRFTSKVTKLFKLIPSDTDRLITDIVTDLVYPQLAQDVQEVLRTLVFIEKQIATGDNRWFKVRIMPYRTLDNRIDGAVITFLDITIARNLETQLRENEQEMQALFNHMTNAFALFESVYEADGSISDFGFVYLNTAFEQVTGVKKNQVQGKSMCAFWDACDDELIKMCANVAVTGQSKRFEINTLVEEKRYSCSIYRPGESQDRICMILDEIRE